MAVVDFRSGGFQGAQPQRHAQDYPYGDDPAAEGNPAEWQGDWDEHYPAQSHDPALIESPSLLGRVSRLTHYVGALVSVGLVIILGVWGFKLVVRDVSGVPVIRAVQGEARTAPEDPGGELSDRTGLAVNSVASGEKPGRVDKVALAPGATGLEDGDTAMGTLGATVQQPSRAVELPPLEDATRTIAQSDAEASAAAAVAATAAAAAPAPVETATVEDAMISDAPAAEAPANEALTDLSGEEPEDSGISQALAEAQTAAPVPTPAVAQSDRPAPRPRRAAAASIAAADATPAPAAATAAAPVAASRPEAAPAKAAAAAPADQPAADAPAAKVATGSAMVQIGAFDSDALAKGEWSRVSGKFGALFAGKSRVVQEAQSGGRTFWRLRAGGFASKDEARRFCAALIAEGVDCIPAVAK